MTYIDVTAAAKALGLSVRRAREIAAMEAWRHDESKPRRYLLTDVARTAKQRRASTTHQ